LQAKTLTHSPVLGRLPVIGRCGPVKCSSTAPERSVSFHVRYLPGTVPSYFLLTSACVLAAEVAGALTRFSYMSA
jgi:hypothetical protein